MNEQLTRRGFLVCAAALGLGACVQAPWYAVPDGAAAWPVEVPLSALEPEGFVVIGGRQGQAALLLRRAGEVFSAVELVCTHRGCALRVQRDQLACPCHGSRFALDGALLQGPATTPLRAYPVTSTPQRTLLIHGGSFPPAAGGVAPLPQDGIQLDGGLGEGREPPAAGGSSPRPLFVASKDNK